MSFNPVSNVFLRLFVSCCALCLILLARPVSAAEFKILADAATSVDFNHPDQLSGPVRGEWGPYEKHKVYLRFFVGWVKGRQISKATLHMTLGPWGAPGTKSFGMYALKDGTPGDNAKGWSETTVTWKTAPGNVLADNTFDRELTEKVGVWNIGEDKALKEGDPVAFESEGLANAISADTNGYITLAFTLENGAGDNSCFQGRSALGDKQPYLDVVTDGDGGVDMTQPTFVVTSGARQTISGYGCGSGGDHGIKIPATYWNSNGQNLGDLSDQPERIQKYFDMLFKDTGANSIRLWMGDMDLKSWDRGYYQTGEFKAAQRAGVTRFFLCTNPPPSMWAPAPTPDSFGVQPLSDAGVKDYPEMLAEFALRVKKKYGIEFYMITIANEEIRLTLKQWPLVVKNLRKALDERGLTKVKIGAVDWPSNDNYLWARVKAIQDDPEAWKYLDVLTFHSYGMSMTENVYDQFIDGQPGKEMWETESNSGGPTASSPAKDIAGHMMNDINHGTSTWIYHELGLAQRDHQSELLGYDPNGTDSDWLNPLPKYYYFKQMTTTFPVGTKIRRIWSSTEGDAWYPGWGTPKLLATGGVRPDGGWGLAMLNTGEDNVSDPQRSAAFAVEELANVPKLQGTLTRLAEGPSKDFNLTPKPDYKPTITTTEPIEIDYGVIPPLTLGPNELVTIQTKPVDKSLGALNPQ